MSERSQIEDMVVAWTRLQRELWDCWAKAIGTNNPELPWEEAVKRPLQVSQEVMKSFLQIQGHCARVAMQSFNPGDNAPKFVGQYIDQLQEMVVSWLDVQQQGFDNWFKAVNELEPLRSPATRFADAANSLFDAWQEATERTLETQARFMSLVMPMDEKAGPGKGQTHKPKQAA